MIAAIVFIALTTWRRGRQLLTDRMRQKEVPLTGFVTTISANPPVRVPGCECS